MVILWLLLVVGVIGVAIVVVVAGGNFVVGVVAVAVAVAVGFVVVGCCCW